MAGQTHPFQVSSGDYKSVGPIAFLAASVGVDNPTPFFVHFVDAGFGAWVRPNTGGAIVLAPTRGRTILVSANDVPGGGPAPPATSLVASCLAFEDPQAPSAGYPLGTSSTVALASALRATGTYNFDVPSQSFAKGMIVYSHVYTGPGTVTFAISDRDSNLNIISNPYVTSTAISAGQDNILRIYPGQTALANFDANGIIGETPRIVATVTGGNATFATDYALIP